MRDTTGYLLDTNAVSATRRPRDHPHVVAFLAGLEAEVRFLSVLTLGELRRGAAIKARQSRDGVYALTRWIDRIELEYKDRLLPVSTEVAKLWGEFSAQRSRDPVDALIGATAVVHGLTLVTRNIRDFRDLPIKLFNPWKE